MPPSDSDEHYAERHYHPDDPVYDDNDPEFYDPHVAYLIHNGPFDYLLDEHDVVLYDADHFAIELLDQYGSVKSVFVVDHDSVVINDITGAFWDYIQHGARNGADYDDEDAQVVDRNTPSYAVRNIEDVELPDEPYEEVTFVPYEEPPL